MGVGNRNLVVQRCHTAKCAAYLLDEVWGPPNEMLHLNTCSSHEVKAVVPVGVVIALISYCLSGVSLALLGFVQQAVQRSCTVRKAAACCLSGIRMKLLDNILLA